jgi:DNA-binding transcriptional ArsR family regulator
MTKLEHAVSILEALSDPVRLEIVLSLMKEGQQNCTQLCSKFNLSQPAFSHHINKLIRASILNVSKQGTSHLMTVNHTYLEEYGINLSKLSLT